MSKNYELLMSVDRNAKNPTYYAIDFYGDGLPSFIANRSFIYRGRFGKMLSEVMEMLQTQFPNAQRIDHRPNSTDNCQCECSTPFLQYYLCLCVSFGV